MEAKEKTEGESGTFFKNQTRVTGLANEFMMTMIIIMIDL